MLIVYGYPSYLASKMKLMSDLEKMVVVGETNEILNFGNLENLQDKRSLQHESLFQEQLINGRS